jgi:hypothetical protein
MGADSQRDTDTTNRLWADFAEARQEIAVLSLGELSERLGMPPPKLLPLAWLALAVGLGLAVWGRSQNDNPLWLVLGLGCGVYGLVAMSLNRTSIHDYRHRCYRQYIRHQAASLRSGDDDNDDE